MNIIKKIENSARTSTRNNITFSNLNFFNLYNPLNNFTQLNLIESYDELADSINLTSEIGLPSIANQEFSNYYMIKGNNKIFYCDEKFKDNNLYSISHNDDYELINNIVDFSGPSITSKSTAIAYTYSTDYFDALNHYFDANNAPSVNPRGMVLEARGRGTQKFNDYEDNDNTVAHKVASDGSAPGLSGADSCTKYDIDDGNWLESTSPYTKYMTFEDSEIRATPTDAGTGIGHNTRLGKIDITLSHAMLFGGGDSIYKTYVPNLIIYVDAISTAGATQKYVRPTHADDIGSGQEFIANLAKVSVNPNDLILGDGLGTFGLSYRQVKCISNDFVQFNGESFVESGGQVSTTNSSTGSYPSDNISWGDAGKDYVWKYKGQRGDLGDDEAYNISIYFPYTFLYDAGQDGNINDSATIADPGINLQLRFQMDIKEHYDCWHMGRGDSVISNNTLYVPKGILEDWWRINKINIHGFESGVDASTSAQYEHVTENNIECVMNFDTPSNGTADGWDDDWDVVLTSVDNDDLESAFGEKTNFSNTDLTKCPNLGLVFNTANANLTNKKFIKIYMKSNRNSTYNLQGVINLKTNKIKSSTSPNEHGPYQDGPIIIYSIPREDLLIPNEIDSYESETGISQDNAENSSKMKALFKTAVIANNVMYAGNIKQNEVEYPDRMLKSPIGKYPILPESNFIDVATNDGDEIISLKFINDKILQFKKRRLFVINISDEYEYLEETYENLGVNSESQIVETDKGICWINSRGCYLYNGSKVEYLSKNKLAYKNWKDSESSWAINDNFNPSITYLKNEDKLLIYPATESYQEINENYEQSTNNGKIKKVQTTYRRGDTINQNRLEDFYLKRMGYQYDFETESWSVLCDFNEEEQLSLDESPKRTANLNSRMSNFQYDNYNNTCFLTSNPSDIYYCKWNDNPHVTLRNQERDFRIITKDYDLNSPSVNKKIYKAYVTFKSTMIESDKSKKMIQNQDLYATSNVKVYYAINGSNTWTEFSTSSSTNYGSNGLISTDSEATTTLSSNIDNSQDTQFTVNSASNIKVGYVLYVGDDFDSTEYLVDNQGNFEQMLVTGISGSTITVERGYNNTEEFATVQASGQQVNISTGDWITAELKPSESINNIKSIKLKFEIKTSSNSMLFGVPPGFMINDITIIYRPKNVK